MYDAVLYPNWETILANADLRACRFCHLLFYHLVNLRLEAGQDCRSKSCRGLIVGQHKTSLENRSYTLLFLVPGDVRFCLMLRGVIVLIKTVYIYGSSFHGPPSSSSSNLILCCALNHYSYSCDFNTYNRSFTDVVLVYGRSPLIRAY